MKLSRVLSIALASAVLLGSIAQAQPSATVLSSPTQLRSYRAAVTALVPAASATDIFTIAGASGKTITVRTLHCDGSADGAQGVVLSVVKRSTLDTGGTSTAPTAIQLNPVQAAASATLKAYTANPTLGTAVATLAVGIMATTVASPAFNNVGVTFDFTNQNLFITSATAQVSVNANATTFNNNSKVNCWAEWSEQ